MTRVPTWRLRRAIAAAAQASTLSSENRVLLVKRQLQPPSSSLEASLGAPVVVEAAALVSGKPVGLGARDTLRLEGRLSLYGNDLTDETTPFDAGLAWVVALDGPDFIGRDALIKQKAEGCTRKLVGFEMVGRGIARHGYSVHLPSGARVGEVTSGGPAPTLEKNIGLGYVRPELTDPGTQLMIDCRGRKVEAKVVLGPFYSRRR